MNIFGDGVASSTPRLADLAARIRRLRETRGLTQEQFSERCGISISFTSLLERGRRAPSYETLLRISQALEVSLAELVGDALHTTRNDRVYGRLIDFARRHQLSSDEIDRLLKVAEAMFPNHLSKQRVASRPRAQGCEIEGCQRPVLAKGLCVAHYHRARRKRGG